MANFTALKTAINNAIKTNGNEEITGAILQAILDAMVETLGDSAITDLENALTTEVTNRENAVGDVATDLAAEALARANKDNQLDNRINQEEYNRQNADAALSQTMSQGFQTLGSQMTALNAAISALNAAYQNGYLYGGIATPSSSPSNNKCFYIALQGGTYTNFGGVGVVEGINIIKNDSGWKVEHIYDQTTLLNEFYLLRQQVIRALASVDPIVIQGDVTNAPDEEDLTSNAQHLLKFKDRAYSPLNFSGLGMKILRKNILPLSDSVAFNGFLEGVTAEETLAGSPELIFWDRMNTRFVGSKDGIYYAAWTDDDNYVPVSTSLVYMYDGTPYQWTGSDFIVDETEVPNLVNCLTQDMINEANTIYIIRYDYTLKEDITIPANCVLEFDGGSLSNGTIVGQDTIISHQNTCIFNNVYLDGSYIKDNVSYSNLFNIEYDDKALFESLDRIGYNIYLNSSRVYNLSSSVNIYAKSVYSDKRATINIYHVSDTNSSGLIFQSPESEVHNVLFVGHYDEIAGHDVYNGCAIGAYVSDESRTEPKRSLHIHDCKFEGHYASSIILSSYITHAIIENCDFSNVIVEDHVVYFAEAIKGITIKNCLISISSTASISGRANKIKVRNASCDVVIEGVNMSNASDLFAAEDMKSLTSIVFKDVNINTESEVSAGANTPIASIVNSEIESLKFVSCKISVNNESGNFKQLVYTGSNTTREVKNLEVNSCDFTNISLAFTCPVRKYTIANSKYSNIDAPHNDTRVLWTRDNTQINILCVGCTFTMKGDALFKVISPAKIIIIGSDIGGNVIGIISHETQTVADYLSLYGNTYSGVTRLVNSASIGVVMYTDDYTKLPQNFNSNYKWLNATFGKTVERPNGAYIDKGHVFFDKDLYSELIAVYKDDSNNVIWKKSIYVSPEVKTHGSSSDRPEGNTTNYGFCFFDTDLGHPIFVSNMSGTTNYWKDADGATSGVKRSGATADRPSGNDIYVGFQYFDTSLGDNGKTIWAAAIAETSPYTVTWIDATGATV